MGPKEKKIFSEITYSSYFVKQYTTIVPLRCDGKIIQQGKVSAIK